mmetsp:Transcript_7055/g.11877  ORF Transcript_7055/g.11877 Transcript_7055/m.11877 type:complete len:102 (+) Transcript_7055:3-308(+)
MIPQHDSCRFISIEDIKLKIQQDSFSYKSVRVIGRIRKLQDMQTGYCIIKSIFANEKKLRQEEEAVIDTGKIIDAELDEEEMKVCLHVDTYNLKNNQMEVN